jgi:seryl-tRNA synthetase
VFLELALVQWTLRKLRGTASSRSSRPCSSARQALFGTGFLPDTEQQIYHLPEDDLYLAGTSEVALASLHAGELLEEDELPRCYAGFSPCFRREAGARAATSAGSSGCTSSTRSRCSASCARGVAAWHERLLAIEEEILTELGSPTAS